MNFANALLVKQGSTLMLKQVLFFAVFALSVNLFSFSADAYEGFSVGTDSAPRAVRRAWDKTFAATLSVESEQNIRHATAFLVDKKQVGDVIEYYFLTSGHFVDGICELNEPCTHLNFLTNIKAKSRLGFMVIVSGLAPQFTGPTLIAMSDDRDWALFRSSVNGDFPDLPRPLRLAARCGLQKGEKLYSVSVPDVGLRRFSMEDDTVEKNWSAGLFLGPVDKFESTTVDALPGSEGGPILNEDGEVVSLVVHNDSVPESKYRYSGTDAEDSNDWQTLGLQCETLKALGERLEIKQPIGTLLLDWLQDP